MPDSESGDHDPAAAPPSGEEALPAPLATVTPSAATFVSPLPTLDPVGNLEVCHAAPEGRYAIQGEFARGGLGRILRAHDRLLDRPVALKELLGGRVNAETRFVREAMLTARLEHPAIVPVHDAGRLPGGAFFYAMKLVSGRNLAELIQERHGLAERLSLLPHVIAVCEAIAYAHAQRVIHRDLKPHNVLVGPFGETVVIDWGLAKEVGWTEAPEDRGDPLPETASGDGLTVAGTIVGTPAYMPLEQARAGRSTHGWTSTPWARSCITCWRGSRPTPGRGARRFSRTFLQGRPVRWTGSSPAPRGTWSRSRTRRWRGRPRSDTRVPRSLLRSCGGSRPVRSWAPITTRGGSSSYAGCGGTGRSRRSSARS